MHKGKLEIQALVDHLSIQHRDDTVDSSHRLYRLALQHNFTRGRRVNQVGMLDAFHSVLFVAWESAPLYRSRKRATPPETLHGGRKHDAYALHGGSAN